MNVQGGPQGGSLDTELFSEVLRVQTKVFYVDLKENARGKYLKVAEKGKYRPKSSIVVPLSGLAQFIILFDYYTAEIASGRPGQAKDLIVESKVFNFATGDNERGRYLRIFESGGGYPAGGSSLMIPAGGGISNLGAFRDCLERVAAFLGQDVTSALAAQSSSMASTLPAALAGAPDSVVLDVAKEGAPVLSVGSKHFFFDLRRNERGQYLKIKEVSGNMKNLLVVPLAAVAKFQEAISMALMAAPAPDTQQQQQHNPGGLPLPLR